LSVHGLVHSMHISTSQSGAHMQSRAVTCAHIDGTKQWQRMLTLCTRAARAGLCGSIGTAPAARTGLLDFLTLRLAGRCTCLSRHLLSVCGLVHSLRNVINTLTYTLISQSDVHIPVIIRSVAYTMIAKDIEPPAGVQQEGAGKSRHAVYSNVQKNSYTAMLRSMFHTALCK